jgi:hypothetical protein
MASSTTAKKKPKLEIVKILGRGRALKRVKGADGLTVALTLSKSNAKLQQLEILIAGERKFMVADTRRFNAIMNELFYDDVIHFGSNNHWLALRKSERLSTAIPSGVAKIFKQNPEAGRFLMAEMASKWASGDAKESGDITMTRDAILKAVEAMRASPEAVMRFIGSRYAIGRYREAAIAFRHAQRLGYQTIMSDKALLGKLK